MVEEFYTKFQQEVEAAHAFLKAADRRTESMEDDPFIWCTCSLLQKLGDLFHAKFEAQYSSFVKLGVHWKSYFVEAKEQDSFSFANARVLTEADRAIEKVWRESISSQEFIDMRAAFYAVYVCTRLIEPKATICFESIGKKVFYWPQFHDDLNLREKPLQIGKVATIVTPCIVSAASPHSFLAKGTVA